MTTKSRESAHTPVIENRSSSVIAPGYRVVLFEGQSDYPMAHVERRDPEGSWCRFTVHLREPDANEIAEGIAKAGALHDALAQNAALLEALGRIADATPPNLRLDASDIQQLLLHIACMRDAAFQAIRAATGGTPE